jgi:transposase
VTKYCGVQQSNRRTPSSALAQSAKLHGHDPWVYLKDVLERLLAHPNNRIDELLPHRWKLAA